MTCCLAQYNVRATKGEATWNSRIEVQYVFTEGEWIYQRNGFLGLEAEMREGALAPELLVLKDMVMAAFNKLKAEDLPYSGTEMDAYKKWMIFPLKTEKVYSTKPEYHDLFDDGFYFEYRVDVEAVNKKKKAFLIENLRVRIHKMSVADPEFRVELSFDHYTTIKAE